jgi:tetratricopeptide (TPR) repeat protein
MEQLYIRPNFFRRALEITWLATIFLIPLFLDPLSYNIFALNKAILLQFLVGIMLAFWVADWIYDRAGPTRLKWQDILASPLHLSILVFGLLAVLSTAASITPAISFWGSYFRKAGLLNLICWILFFLIVAQQIRNRAQLLRAVYTLLLSSAIVSITGILQYYLPDAMSRVLPNPITVRISSTIGNPLFLSSFLAMVIPFSLALIIYLWNKRKQGNNVGIFISLIILLALQFWCLWLAQYSITILLYSISLIIFIIIWGVVRRNRLLLSVGALCLLVLVIVASLLVVPLLLPTRNVGTPGILQNLESTPLSSEAIGLKTLGWRAQYWQSTVDILLKSPVVPFSNDKLHFLRKLIGYGPETFIITSQLVFPQKLKSDNTYNLLLLDRPHNDYLYLTTTMGLLGLMSFISILAVFFYLCFRYLRRATEDIDKLFLIAMAAGIVQYMADIFFNLSTISPELVFWLMLAMTCAIGRFIGNKEQVSTKPAKTAHHKAVVPLKINKLRFRLSVLSCVILIIAVLATNIRPFIADIYFEKGLNLITKGDKQIIYNFDKATSLEPKEATYWHAIGDYRYFVARHTNEEATKTKFLSLATSGLSQAVNLNRYIAFERYTLADIYTYWAEIGAADKWPEALSLYDEASQLFPDNAVILDKWALALIIKGDFDEAGTKLASAVSNDPEWAQTSFLSGLLLAREGKYEEAITKTIGPIRDDPSNINYFVDLCRDLVMYDMIIPLRNTLGTYTAEAPDDWVGHTLLGITNLFIGKVGQSLNEFNTAIRLVPGEDAGYVFRTVLNLSTISPAFKTSLQAVAADWRDKLSQSPESDALLPVLDQLTGGTK